MSQLFDLVFFPPRVILNLFISRLGSQKKTHKVFCRFPKKITNSKHTQTIKRPKMLLERPQFNDAAFFNPSLRPGFIQCHRAIRNAQKSHDPLQHILMTSTYFFCLLSFPRFMYSSLHSTTILIYADSSVCLEMPRNLMILYNIF